MYVRYVYPGTRALRSSLSPPNAPAPGHGPSHGHGHGHATDMIRIEYDSMAIRQPREKSHDCGGGDRQDPTSNSNRLEICIDRYPTYLPTYLVTTQLGRLCAGPRLSHEMSAETLTYFGR